MTRQRSNPRSGEQDARDLSTAAWKPLRVAAEERPAQILPEAVHVVEAGPSQRRQLLREVGRKRARGARRGWPLCPRRHRLDAGARPLLAPPPGGRRRAVALLESGSGRVDQVDVQEDAARLRPRTDLTVNLADSREAPEVVQADRRHDRV